MRDMKKIDDIFEEIEKRVENVFDNFFQKKNFSLFDLEAAWRPLIEIYETNKTIVIKMEIPGLQLKDFSIYFHDNILIIRGRREDQCKSEAVDYYCMEINYGIFERKILFNQPVDKRKMRAKYRYGFLEITLPKIGHKNAPLSVHVY